MRRYIGLDAHATSCTFAVLSERGRRLDSASQPIGMTVSADADACQNQAFVSGRNRTLWLGAYNAHAQN
jgi:hypothetical protein